VSELLADWNGALALFEADCNELLADEKGDVSRSLALPPTARPPVSTAIPATANGRRSKGNLPFLHFMDSSLPLALFNR
jgi:hypothetical protein